MSYLLTTHAGHQLPVVFATLGGSDGFLYSIRIDRAVLVLEASLRFSETTTRHWIKGGRWSDSVSGPLTLGVPASGADSMSQQGSYALRGDSLFLYYKLPYVVERRGVGKTG